MQQIIFTNKPNGIVQTVIMFHKHYSEQFGLIQYYTVCILRRIDCDVDGNPVYMSCSVEYFPTSQRETAFKAYNRRKGVSPEAGVSGYGCNYHDLIHYFQEKGLH